MRAALRPAIKPIATHHVVVAFASQLARDSRPLLCFLCQLSCEETEWPRIHPLSKQASVSILFRNATGEPMLYMGIYGHSVTWLLFIWTTVVSSFAMIGQEYLISTSMNYCWRVCYPVSVYTSCSKEILCFFLLPIAKEHLNYIYVGTCLVTPTVTRIHTRKKEHRKLICISKTWFSILFFSANTDFHFVCDVSVFFLRFFSAFFVFLFVVRCSTL